MPTSVPGPANHQDGFTLLEMMVVLLIIGIATAMAGVSAFGTGGTRALRQDAQRLAHLFTAAQAEARTSGQAIAWVADGNGFHFARVPRRLALPAHLSVRTQPATDSAIGGNTHLRPRKWISPDTVTVRLRPDAGLVFGPDWLPGPLEMTLEADGNVVRLSRLGNGQFVVTP